MIFWLPLCVFLRLVIIVYNNDDDNDDGDDGCVDWQCQVRSRRRVDCGYFGITRHACLVKGCCWDTQVWDAPWCFYSSQTTDPRHDDDDDGDDDTLCGWVSVWKRSDCGYPGIDRLECLQRGCCYDTSVPFCYHQPTTNDYHRQANLLNLPDFLYNDYYGTTFSTAALYCDDRLSVCLSVSPHLWNHLSKRHHIFCACYLRP